MCGISGYLVHKPLTSSRQLSAMSASIYHRGPDDEGLVFINMDTSTSATYSSARSPAKIQSLWPMLQSSQLVASHHVGLSQVRYSIIDLSPDGHQPMWSACGNVCLTFNGEIYNYLELREELIQAGFRFRTRSDTEVLVYAYLAWGDKVFSKLNGFFALALYDKRRNAVLLGRDRLGVAHLYFHRHSDQSIFWASEIKALLASGCVDRTSIDDAAVADFLLFNKRDRGGTFWRGVEDFPPGHYAWVALGVEFQPKRYWSLPATRWSVANLSRDAAATGLRDLLTEALRLRLRADVPIGFELSGGMDSSALVGLAAGRLGEKLTSYTVEFEEAHSNEEPFARAVAQRYPQNIDYRVIKQPKESFWEEADRFVWIQEEPFHAPNLHTNQYLRRMMKADGAHVVITGAAGDEMLAGYAGDYLGPFLRHLLATGQLRRFYSEISQNSEITAGQSLKGLLADLFLTEENRALRGMARTGELGLLEKVLPENVFSVPLRCPSAPVGKTFHGRTMANMTHRLMNYWLRSGAKSDYGIPIESRAPFLDYRVVEYCCQLPPEYLISGGWHKHVLRLAVKDYLPEQVVWRRQKMGFPFPYREWLIASRAVAEKNATGIDCPYINTKALFAHYDDFVKTTPVTLWRLLSVLLWWRRVIENREIHPS